MKKIVSIILIVLILISGTCVNVGAEEKPTIKVTGYSSSKVYNGKKQTQSGLKVYYNDIELINKKDYAVTYKNNKNVGAAKIIITLKGKYTGSKVVKFKINPKPTKIVSLNPTVQKIKVKWSKKTVQSDGYQIEYSASAKFENSKRITIKKDTTTVKTIGNLNAKNKYYIRVRTYKKTDGKVYFSKWCTKKSAVVPVKKYTYTPDIKVLLNSENLHPQKTNAEKLDALVTKIFKEIHTKNMTTYEKVKACYDYLVDTTTYKAWITYDSTLTDGLIYESYYDYDLIQMAYYLLSTKTGGCDSYSAAFVVMCRRLGLDAQIIGGTVSKKGGGRTGHAWSYIKLNGTDYIFDAQVQSNNKSFPYYYFGKTYTQMGSTYEISKDMYNVEDFRNFNCYMITY